MAKNVLNWTRHNKMLVLFACSSFCLLISTVALAQKKAGFCARDAYLMQKIIKNKQQNGLMEHDNKNDFLHGDNYYKLPKNVKPTHYDLYLSPSMTNKTFKGTVTIALRVLEKTKIITLHSNKLTINSVKFKNIDNNFNISIQSTKLVTDKREFLHVELKKIIPEGYFKLHIKFEGKLDNGIIGFYSSSLKNGGLSQKDRVVLVEQPPTSLKPDWTCTNED